MHMLRMYIEPRLCYYICIIAYNIVYSPSPSPSPSWPVEGGVRILGIREVLPYFKCQQMGVVYIEPNKTKGSGLQLSQGKEEYKFNN